MNRASAIVLALGGLLLLGIFAALGLAVADLRGDPTANALWVWAGRIWIASCGLTPLALLALLLGGVYAALRYAHVYSRTHAPLVYHVRGLLPAVADGGPRLDAPHRNHAAEVAQASFDGGLTRIGASGLRHLAAAADEPPAELLPAPLPERIDIFSAPLPNRPALLLGHGASGPVILDLDEGGHVLVAGSPRSGKSNWLGSVIALAARQYPRGDTVQIALSDLKRLDFATLIGSDLALLRWPMATSVPDALELARAVEAELDRRLALLAAVRARTIADYNRSNSDRLPYILQIIDEIGELSAHPDRDVRDRFAASVQRVGQLGSAAGIMQILATQRPSARVVGRTITGICDTRVAFRVATLVESQLILDASGAEDLPLVRGRALVRAGGAITEVQTYYAGLQDGRFDQLLAALPRRLRLPADAEADGLGAADLPDGAAVPYRVPPAPGADLPPPPHMAAVPGTVPAPAADERVPVPAGAPDEALMARIYRTWIANGRNLNAVQRALFCYGGGAGHGGRAYRVCAYAVNAQLQRRGRPPAYKAVEL